MDEREVDERSCAEGVPDAYKGEGHLGPEVVDHVEEVAGVVAP